MPGLLATDRTALPAADFVAEAGTVVASFDRGQDSGNVSWLVDTRDGRYFCKGAGDVDSPPPGAPVPYFDHHGRIALLRNAVDVARSCDHPALATLRAVIETGSGPLLVYDAAPGELVNVPRPRRGDPSSSYRRFAAAPAEVRLRVFDQLTPTSRSPPPVGWPATCTTDACSSTATGSP